MATSKLRWSNLLNLTELHFLPEHPEVLNLSDEIAFSLSLLTAATRHDRKMLRCDDNGVLLVGDPWNGLNPVQADELYVNAGAADSYIASVEHKGVLIATTGYLTEVKVVRVSGGATETIIIAPDTMFWFPHKVYSIEVDDVPDGGALSFYVGITAYN